MSLRGGGGNRRTIVSLDGKSLPYGLALTASNVYWTDWNKYKTLSSYHKKMMHLPRFFHSDLACTAPTGWAASASDHCGTYCRGWGGHSGWWQCPTSVPKVGTIIKINHRKSFLKNYFSLIQPSVRARPAATAALPPTCACPTAAAERRADARHLPGRTARIRRREKIKMCSMFSLFELCCVNDGCALQNSRGKMKCLKNVGIAGRI